MADTKKLNINNLYLKSANIESFGSMTDRFIGDFKPGLNIIYGPNEAGKSTISSFISGVLIGWPRRSVKNAVLNTYKPNNNNRAGSLVFADANNNETYTLSRVNNKDVKFFHNSQDSSIQRKNMDKPTFYAAKTSVDCNICKIESNNDLSDSETDFQLPSVENFSMLNSISAYKLLDLSNTLVKSNNDISGKFLSEEAGTNFAPSSALDSIDKDIFAYGSLNKTNAQKSIASINQQMEDYAQLIAIEEQKETELNKEITSLPQKHKLYKNLESKITKLNNRLTELNYTAGQIQALNEQKYTNKKQDNNNAEDKDSQYFNQEGCGSQRKTNGLSKIFALCSILFAILSIFSLGFAFSGFEGSLFIILTALCILAAFVFVILHVKNKNVSTSKDEELLSCDLKDKAYGQEDLSDCYFDIKIKNICEQINVLPDNINSEIIKIQDTLDKYSDDLKSLNSSIQKIKSMMDVQRDASNYHGYLSEYVALRQKKDLLTRDYFVDILAKKMLIDSINLWHKNSQLDIYASASDYLSVLTGAKWTHLIFESDKLYVSDATGHKILNIDVLSTSTRQLVFLSLRLAIVSCNQASYKYIPVICDDIMVCFDKVRINYCLKALAKLSVVRQVLLFTNNEDVIKYAANLKLDCNVLKL